MAEPKTVSNPVVGGSATLGLIACGVAGADLTAEVMALALHAMGHRFPNLADAFSRLVFDYGFLLDVVAVLLAVVAMARGGRNRRFGLISLAIVAIAFGVLFFPWP